MTRTIFVSGMSTLLPTRTARSCFALMSRRVVKVETQPPRRLLRRNDPCKECAARHSKRKGNDAS